MKRERVKQCINDSVYWMYMIALRLHFRIKNSCCYQGMIYLKHFRLNAFQVVANLMFCFYRNISETCNVLIGNLANRIGFAHIKFIKLYSHWKKRKEKSNKIKAQWLWSLIACRCSSNSLSQRAHHIAASDNEEIKNQQRLSFYSCTQSILRGSILCRSGLSVSRSDFFSIEIWTISFCVFCCVFIFAQIIRN